MKRKQKAHSICIPYVAFIFPYERKKSLEMNQICAPESLPIGLGTTINSRLLLSACESHKLGFTQIRIIIPEFFRKIYFGSYPQSTLSARFDGIINSIIISILFLSASRVSAFPASTFLFRE